MFSSLQTPEKLLHVFPKILAADCQNRSMQTQHQIMPAKRCTDMSEQITGKPLEQVALYCTTDEFFCHHNAKSRRVSAGRPVMQGEISSPDCLPESKNG